MGIISEGDLIRPFGKANKLHGDWWLGLLANGDELAPEFVEDMRLDYRRASDLMIKEVVTVTEDTAVDRIADLLRRHRIKGVPIVKAGKVRGVISCADVIRGMARSPVEMNGSH